MKTNGPFYAVVTGLFLFGIALIAAGTYLDSAAC